MPKSKMSAKKRPTAHYNSTWAQRQLAATIAQDHHIFSLAIAFGISEAEVVADREAWLRAPNWEPSRCGWEAMPTAYGCGNRTVQCGNLGTGSGWGPTPDRSTTDHTWGTGNGWGTATDGTTS
ncbi:hypothetical protein C8F04DRAFT_1252297 [Mycena alexandri]|uniref:Uncharacterized protein n=1 Tax=Mycena alexandri TaxID=1745969 RepID=A0AAD6XEI1_9AGAR|nr:hypothetical protein C8F04DRAFT_1252297 [Mycena alexandri]